MAEPTTSCGYPAKLGLFLPPMDNGGYFQLPKPSDRVDERLKLYENTLTAEMANSKHDILSFLFQRNGYPTCLYFYFLTFL